MHLVNNVLLYYPTILHHLRVLKRVDPNILQINEILAKDQLNPLAINDSLAP